MIGYLLAIELTVSQCQDFRDLAELHRKFAIVENHIAEWADSDWKSEAKDHEDLAKRYESVCGESKK